VQWGLKAVRVVEQCIFDMTKRGAAAVILLGEGKLFAKSFPSPKPPTFQKTLNKGTEKQPYICRKIPFLKSF